jgi:NADPH2:quinone reductase
MRYIEVESYGGPEVLHLREGFEPVPQDNEVLIEVYAAGINRPDCAQRQGTYPPPKGVTEVLGLEVSGVIRRCGANVQRWKVGDKVCALIAGGGYAEFAVAPEGQCLPIPKNLNWVEAAALPETFFTVWANLFESGKLQRGDSVLIHGGAGGIGTTAIQLAKAFGARVFTTVGKKESVAVCLRLGAERVIQYKTEDYVEVVKAATQNQGVDIILDMVGGDYFGRNLEALAPLGRLVQIATLRGATAELDLRKMMFKRLTITGSTLRSRSISEKKRLAQDLEKNVWPLIDRGDLHPVIYKSFPLENAREAHELMESSSHIGKIVLTVRD